MADPTTVVICPACGYPYPMTDKQREVYNGRNMGCMNCGRPFRVEPAATSEDHPEDLTAAAVANDEGGATSASGAAVEAASPVASDDIRMRRNPWAAVACAAGVAFFVLLAVTVITAYVTGTVGAAFDPGGGTATGVLLAAAFAAGVLAVASGIAGILRARRPLTGGRSLSYAGLALGTGGLLVSAGLLAVVLPGITEARARARRDQCYINFQQIGTALVNYVGTSPGGRLPDALDVLVTAGEATPQSLLCPAESDSPPLPPAPNTVPATAPATAPTPATTHSSADPVTPGSMPARLYPSSYVYLGAGKTASTVPPDAVLVYEPAGYHPDGAHFLFADGQIIFCKTQQAAQLQIELRAGQNPPPTAQAVRP